MTKMTDPKRWPNNMMALRDGAADEAHDAMGELAPLLNGKALRPEQAKLIALQVNEHLHQIRLLMSLAGAPIVIETSRGVIEVERDDPTAWVGQ
jgi:hypothetical protein